MPVLTLPKKKKKAPKVAARPTVVVPRYAPPAIPGRPLPGWLSQKLAGLRQRFLLVRVAERLALYCAVALLLLAGQMFLDWLLDLHVAVRALILCGDLALLGFFVHERILPHILRPPGQAACALLVEKHWPAFRGRLIATVQFAQPRYTSGSADLIDALQKETQIQTRHLNFDEIIDTRVLLRRVGVLLIVALAWGALFVAVRPGSEALLRRVFLLSAKVPRKTEVICLSLNKIIPAGDSVTLEAMARGIVPSHGRITLRYDTGRVQEITLDPQREHPDHFSLKIDRVEEPLTYTIQLNDGTSEPYQVKTIPRPNVKSIECDQVYPAYTGLGTVKRNVGNLALLPGSRLQIHALANSKIKKATLKLIGTGQERPLTISGSEGMDLAGEIDIPATGLTGFSIQLTNEADITSGDETQYRIDLIPDRPPTVQITEPERLQELCTLKAKPVIGFLAEDDYGLARVFLCYRVMQGQDVDNGDTPAAAGGEIKKIEMDLGQNHPQNLSKRFQDWNLASLGPAVKEGTNLEYWMAAEDANNVTGPGKAESEHHIIKVVSEMDKKAEITDRMLSGLTELDIISTDQSKINKDLQGIIQAKPESKDSK